MLVALPSIVLSEQIERRASSQDVAGHQVFVTANGAGPWNLQVGTTKKPGEKAIFYSDVQVSAYDAKGNKLVVQPLYRDFPSWIEVGMGLGTQASGIYLVGRTTGSEPTRIEVSIYGRKAVFELKER